MMKKIESEKVIEKEITILLSLTRSVKKLSVDSFFSSIERNSCLILSVRVYQKSFVFLNVLLSRQRSLYSISLNSKLRHNVNSLQETLIYNSLLLLILRTTYYILVDPELPIGLNTQWRLKQMFFER